MLQYPQHPYFCDYESRVYFTVIGLYYSSLVLMDVMCGLKRPHVPSVQRSQPCSAASRSCFLIMNYLIYPREGFQEKQAHLKGQAKTTVGDAHSRRLHDCAQWKYLDIQGRLSGSFLV